jgi:hypothetical protein
MDTFTKVHFYGIGGQVMVCFDGQVLIYIYKIYFLDGKCYEGGWYIGKQHGKGKITLKDG